LPQLGTEKRASVVVRIEKEKRKAGQPLRKRKRRRGCSRLGRA
jgi:hypothetical protein